MLPTLNMGAPCAGYALVSSMPNCGCMDGVRAMKQEVSSRL